MKKMSRFFILFLACVFIFVGCDKKDDKLVSEKSNSVQEEKNNATNKDTNNESNDEHMTASEKKDKIGGKDIKISKIEPVGEIKKSESSDAKWQTVKFTVKNNGNRTLSFSITPYATKKIDDDGKLVEIKEPFRLPISQDHECIEHGSEILPQNFTQYGGGLNNPVDADPSRLTTVTYLEPNEERTYYANITFLEDPNEAKTNPLDVEYKDFVLKAKDFYLTKEDAEKNFVVHVSKKGDFSQKLVNWSTKDFNRVVARYKIKNNTDKYIKEVRFIGENLGCNEDDYLKLTTYSFENFKPGEEKEIEGSLDFIMNRKGVDPKLLDFSAYVVDPEK